MEISKAPVSSQYLASLLRQREVAGVSPRVDAISDRPDLSAERRQDKGRPSSETVDVHSALQALEESQASAEQARKEYPVLDNRARLALSAYMTQENMGHEDARVSLRQMLGVDYYA